MAASAEEIEELYRRRYRSFRDGLAVVTGEYDAARDVVQEAFAQALRDRRQYRGDGSLAAWIWKIALRIALRSRTNERQSVSLDDLVAAAPLASPESDPILGEALKRLSPRRRLIVFLHYFADLPYAEIASLCDISEGTVAATLAQARADLLKDFHREGTPTMNDTQVLEERLRGFATGADDADWDDVLRRASEAPTRSSTPVLRRRLALALSGCAVAAAVVAVASSGVLSTHRPGRTTAGPLQFSPIDFALTRDANGQLTSIDVTVRAATLGGTAQVQVVRGPIEGQETASPSQVVFQEQVPMTDISSPPNASPGAVPLSSWSGTLSPTTWNGGCQGGPYELTVTVSPAVNPTTGGTSGEYAESGSFTCTS